MAGASSLRNAVKRKTHKERAQPAGRKKLGLLEKHKDYVLRARDFSFKRQRLEALRKKAAARNEDEFYFGMVNAKTKNGVHISGSVGGKPSVESGPKHDALLKLYRTQNASYLESRLKHERRARERVEEGLHRIGDFQGSHTVFVDNDEQAEEFDPAEYFETDPDLVEAVPYNRLRNEQLAAAPVSRQAQLSPETLAAKARADREKAYAKLEKANQTLLALERTRNHLDLKRNLQGKGKRVKIRDAEGDRPAAYKWKTERKR